MCRTLATYIFFHKPDKEALWGGLEIEKEKRQCSRENRVLFKLLRDRKVCHRALLMRDAQPGTAVIWTPSTPGQQEANFCSCSTSKAFMSLMCLKRPVGQFLLWPNAVPSTICPAPNPNVLFPSGSSDSHSRFLNRKDTKSEERGGDALRPLP